MPWLLGKTLPVCPDHAIFSNPKAGKFRRTLGIFSALVLALSASHAWAAPITTSAYLGHTVGGGFNAPYNIAIDTSGNVYVADQLNQAVIEIPAGCTDSGCVINLGGDFNYPQAVAVDTSGNVFVADTNNAAIKKIPPGCVSDSSCVITLVTSNKMIPSGIAVDSSGNVYFSDLNAFSVYELPLGCSDSSCLIPLGGLGAFSQPMGLAVDAFGDIFVADAGSASVFEMTAGCADSSCITTLAGVPTFTMPSAVTVDSTGTVYVADYSTGLVSQTSGTGCGCSPTFSPINAAFGHPSGVAVDAKGNIYVADIGASPGVVQEVVRQGQDLGAVAVQTPTPATATVTFTFTASVTAGLPTVLTLGAPSLDFTDAGTGTCTVNGAGYSYVFGDICTVKINFNPLFPGTRFGAVTLLDQKGNTLATGLVSGTGNGPQPAVSLGNLATLGGGFAGPLGLAVDATGNVYVADESSFTVREIPFGCTVDTCVKDLGHGAFSDPVGVAVDGAGNVYVTDGSLGAVMEMPPGCADETCVTTLNHWFSDPAGIALDANGTIYVADAIDGVEQMAPNCSSANCLVPLGGPTFTTPTGVAVDGSGNIYYSDYGAGLVKSMPPGCAADACVTTIGGTFIQPFSLQVDASGTVYVADTSIPFILEIPPGCTSDACVLPLGCGCVPAFTVALDAQGNTYFTDVATFDVTEMDRTNAGPLSFLQTEAGQTSTDSPAYISLQNVGNQELNVTAVNYAPNFPEDPGSSGDCTSSTVLSTAGVCYLSIDFSPLVSSATGFITNLTGSVSVSELVRGSAVTQSGQVSGTEIYHKPPVLLTPLASADPGGSTLFSWDPGFGTDGFFLTIGTKGPGNSSIFSSGVLGPTITSRAVTVPALGTRVFVRLNYLMDSTWSHFDYTFDERPTPPSLTSPSPTSDPTGNNTLFAWNSGVGPTRFSLSVGSKGPGTNDIFSSGGLDSSITSQTVNVPNLGTKIYVRLNWLVGIYGVWKSVDYTFNEAGTPPSLTSPLAGSDPSGSTLFSWTSGVGPTRYALAIGTTGPGSFDIFSSPVLDSTVTSQTVNIPAFGTKIYVRLNYLVGSYGTWYHVDYTFNEAPTPPALTSPASGVDPTGSTLFAWNPGIGPTRFSLTIGTTGAGSTDIFSSGGLDKSVTSQTVTVPNLGTKIYVRLNWLVGNYGTWNHIDYTFSEAPTAPSLTSPSGSSIPSGSTVFTWDPGVGPTRFSFQVGTKFAHSDIFLSGGLDKSVTSQTVNIPSTVSKIYVRINWLVGAYGQWKSVDYSFDVTH